ncbi:MAG: glycosyltransferase [Candidatus Levybacteria bacterium]|nr:glycosyltransferase [Candidatus Levybacteria bacterium]
MRIGILLPSIFGSNRYLKGRIFAPLTPAVALADKLVEKGHNVFFYGSRDIQTKAEVVSGDPNLTDTDPFFYLFRYRDPLEQKYSTAEIIKRDFEYDLAMRAYDDAVNKKKLDVIHAYHDFGAHYFNELTHFPTVYTLHDPLPQTKDTIEYHRLSKFTQHNYVSISNSQRKGVVSLNFVDTVYHGLDIKEYEFDNNPEEHLIYFGRVLEDKGTDIAIKVAMDLEIPLRIATSTIRANKSAGFYDTKIAPYIDGKNVILSGFVEKKEKSDFIKKGKAFIFPLRWDEPFGLTIIESMACGTPVIAYNRGSASELVRDGVTGFVIEPEESQNESKFVIKKKGQEGLMEAVKRIGEIDRAVCRKHVEDNFTVDKMTEGYEKVYKKIIG